VPRPFRKCHRCEASSTLDSNNLPTLSAGNAGTRSLSIRWLYMHITCSEDFLTIQPSGDFYRHLHFSLFGSVLSAKSITCSQSLLGERIGIDYLLFRHHVTLPSLLC